MKIFESEITKGNQVDSDLSEASMHYIHASDDSERTASQIICREHLERHLNRMSAKSDFNDVAIIEAKMMYIIATKTDLKELADEYESVVVDVLQTNGLPPIAQMTYQDIILNNPSNKILTFTTGEAAISEASFYRGHQIIEGHMNTVIDSLRLAYQTDDAALLTLADADAAQATIMMKRFGTELNKDHFHVFKPYFDTNPYTDQKGPSGAFSATIPHVDILLTGVSKYEGYKYLEDNALYFPLDDFAKLKQSVCENIDISEQFKTNARAMDALQSIAENLVVFRNMHKGAVSKHIGKHVMGSAEGGSALSFLQRHIDDAKDRVETIKGKKKDNHGPSIPTL